MIFVDGGHTDLAGHHDVGLLRGVANFVDSLASGKSSDLDLCSQDGSLFIVEKLKQRNVSQFFRITRHVVTSFTCSQAAAELVRQNIAEWVANRKLVDPGAALFHRTIHP